MNDHHELDDLMSDYLADGYWSAFGIAASVQPQPISVLEGGKMFFLYEPQQWVHTCLFTDSDALDLLCETKC